MRVIRRAVTITVAATAAVTAGLGLGLGGSASALTATDAAAGATVGTVQAYIVFHVATDETCGGLLQSAQVKTGGPADVSVYIENQESGEACTGWLERSVNKGRTWTVVSPKIAVPSNKSVFTWAKSADYADGPGRIARACVRLGSGPVVCSGAMGLRASSARDTGAAIPVSYVRRQVNSTGAIFCTARLSSTSTGKSATSSVRAYIGDFSPAKACTGMLESSSNGGRTWQIVSAALALPASSRSGVIQTAAYGPRYPDAKGHLARVCITVAGRHYCTGAW